MKFDPQVALHWWENLQDDTGERARLCRASSLQEAMLEQQTVKLHQDLGLSRNQYLTTALIASVLAHVREDAPGQSVPMACQGVVAEKRIIRLLHSVRGEEDCMIAFCRLVAQLGRKVNVADLAKALWDWNDVFRGDRCRTTWTLEFWGAEESVAQ